LSARSLSEGPLGRFAGGSGRGRWGLGGASDGRHAVENAAVIVVRQGAQGRCAVAGKGGAVHERQGARL
jgi:hypothetical protein